VSPRVPDDKTSDTSLESHNQTSWLHDKTSVHQRNFDFDTIMLIEIDIPSLVCAGLVGMFSAVLTTTILGSFLYCRLVSMLDRAINISGTALVKDGYLTVLPSIIAATNNNNNTPTCVEEEKIYSGPGGGDSDYSTSASIYPVGGGSESEIDSENIYSEIEESDVDTAANTTYMTVLPSVRKPDSPLPVLPSEAATGEDVYITMRAATYENVFTDNIYGKFGNIFYSHKVTDRQTYRQTDVYIYRQIKFILICVFPRYIFTEAVGKERRNPRFTYPATPTTTQW
jgi:hypothetical protein